MEQVTPLLVRHDSGYLLQSVLVETIVVHCILRAGPVSPKGGHVSLSRGGPVSRTRRLSRQQIAGGHCPEVGPERLWLHLGWLHAGSTAALLALLPPQNLHSPPFLLLFSHLVVALSRFLPSPILSLPVPVFICISCTPFTHSRLTTTLLSYLALVRPTTVFTPFRVDLDQPNLSESNTLQLPRPAFPQLRPAIHTFNKPSGYYIRFDPIPI